MKENEVGMTTSLLSLQGVTLQVRSSGLKIGFQPLLLIFFVKGKGFIIIFPTDQMHFFNNLINMSPPPLHLYVVSSQVANGGVDLERDNGFF